MFNNLFYGISIGILQSSISNIPMDETFILYNGDVTICGCPAPKDKFPIAGNILTTSLNTIFNSEQMNLIRARLEHGIYGCYYCQAVCSHRFSPEIPKSLYA
jgi:hypothetical protein